MQLTWDHVGSSLDARESAFELNANGGVLTWRTRLLSWFDGYNDLVDDIRPLLRVELPPMDLSSLQDVPYAPPRPVTPPSARD